MNRVLAIFRFRIGATGSSLSCGLCKGYTIQPKKGETNEMGLPVAVRAMTSERKGKWIKGP
jgi:hypothetical protein